MAFGSYAVRYAPSHDKKKWVIEIHKTARAALKAAKNMAMVTGRLDIRSPPVCIFDMARWGRKPVCIRPSSGKTSHVTQRYAPAPHGIKVAGPGGRMKRLAKDSQGNPIVKYDGYRRRKSRR